MPLFQMQNTDTPKKNSGVALPLWIRKYLLPAVALLLLTAVLFFILVFTVSESMQSKGEEKLCEIPKAKELHTQAPFDCILVLGAGLQSDGTPSAMLHDRITVGVELYQALDGVPLLMSGDQTGDYNEVAAMKTLALSLDVPEEMIYQDSKGYSTYESILRAKQVYGAKRILIVTQTYHLHRALYLAESLEIEAYGVSADLRPYKHQRNRDAREALARFKDLFNGAKKEHPIYLDPTVFLKDSEI